MTFLCICFRYSLYSIRFLSSPKIKIIMYFDHLFPLTSHIRGNLLSTWMAPLHLSANISHVGTQKDIYGLRVAQKHYRWPYYELHLSSIQLIIFTLLISQVMYTTRYICNSCVVREYRLLHLTYRFVRGLPLEKLVCHTRVANINTCVHLPLTLKIINSD